MLRDSRAAAAAADVVADVLSSSKNDSDEPDRIVLECRKRNSTPSKSIPTPVCRTPSTALPLGDVPLANRLPNQASEPPGWDASSSQTICSLAHSAMTRPLARSTTHPSLVNVAKKTPPTYRSYVHQRRSVSAAETLRAPEPRCVFAFLICCDEPAPPPPHSCRRPPAVTHRAPRVPA